ncbi:hypothetical protein vseg_010711 [Gypsophila vaccaria]
MSNPGSVPAASNSKLSPLPPEPADFYNPTANGDIPLDLGKDLKKKKRELKAKETELRKREEVSLSINPCLDDVLPDPLCPTLVIGI